MSASRLSLRRNTGGTIIVDDSFLYGYDEFNVGAAFQSAAAVSIAYSLMSRCGLEADDRFEHEDFLSIFDFNTPEAAAELGTAVSRINGEVLRQIEVTIKNYEREKLAERSHIDDALRAWNGNIGSKHAVVRYMEQHGREKETAAWLAHEYGGNENNNLFIVRAGSPETVELTWPKVQRRLAQLIREDKFFTEQEKSVLEQNRNYLILDRLRADCEYFLGAGNRAEKHLWAGSVYAQIVKMRELYDALPQKPEWLTKEMIDDYADRMAPQYQVVVYHHFENGFEEKRDYQTLEEAEKAAQGYVDGTMESDGFAYDGAAIYDQQARKYLRIYGDYPDERAHAEVP